MRILQHSFKSLVRKPVKGIMIFFIMVLVFGLVFTGMIVRNSVAESKDYVRIKLGATVQFTPDYMKAMVDEIEDYSIMQPSESLANSISDDDRVKGVYLVKNVWTQAKGIKSARDDRDQFEGEMPDDYDYPIMLDMVGTSQSQPIEFEIGNLKLEEGAFFSDDAIENGALEVLITTELAAKNNLNVGDSITIVNEQKMYSSDVYDPDNPEFMDDFKIVGIYSGQGKEMSDKTYIPLETAWPYTWDGEEDLLDNAYLLLHDPLDVTEFIADHEDKLPNEYVTLTANDEEYKQLTQPLDLLELITSILIWVIFVAGALIVLSIVTIFVRDRKFEIGLLLASGESKLNIITQFIFEIFVVAIIAFIVAAGASQLSSGFVGDWIVENQLQSEETDEEAELMIMYGYYDQTKGQVNMDNIAEDFDVSLQFDMIVNLLLISLGILLFAASIPLIVIMSYKPREALQD